MALGLLSWQHMVFTQEQWRNDTHQTKRSPMTPASLTELSPGKCRSLLNGLAMASHIFWGPNPSSCREMVKKDYIQDLMELASILGEENGASARAMASYLAEAEEPGELCRQLEESYVPLFVNNHGGAAAPPYHSCYEGEQGLLMGRPAEMMARRLEAAGIDLAELTSEPPDHLAVELEYLFLLLEAAFSQDDPRLLAEARSFAGQEMLPWLESFRQRLGRQSANLLYPSAADLVLAMVRLAAG